MAESKTKDPVTYVVITEKRDPHITADGEPLVVSTRTLTVAATSEADAKSQVDLSEGESVISVSTL
jgi:hypothetical protein